MRCLRRGAPLKSSRRRLGGGNGRCLREGRQRCSVGRQFPQRWVAVGCWSSRCSSVFHRERRPRFAAAARWRICCFGTSRHTRHAVRTEAECPLRAELVASLFRRCPLAGQACAGQVPWPPPSGTAEDRNTLDHAEPLSRGGSGRRPPGRRRIATSTRSTRLRSVAVWPSPFGMTEDRNSCGYAGAFVELAAAVALRDDGGSQLGQPPGRRLLGGRRWPSPPGVAEDRNHQDATSGLCIPGRPPPSGGAEDRSC